MSSYFRQKLISILFVLLVAIGWYGLYLHPVADTDFGWHYRCGEQFIQTGNWCFKNEYSYFLSGYVWGYSTLIYDVLIFWTYNSFGFNGVAHLGAFLLTIMTLAWYQRFGRLTVLNVWIYFFGALSLIALGFRAQVFTLFYAGLFWALLPLKMTEGRSSYLKNGLIILMFWFWANTHPGLVLILGIYGLFCLIRYILGERVYFGYLVLAVIASLLTPQGFGMYQEIFQHSQTNLAHLIVEWLPPAFETRVLIVCTAIFFGWFVLRSMVKERWKQLFYGVVLLGLTILSVGAKRHIPHYWLYIFFLSSELRLIEKLALRLKIPIKTLIESSAVLTVLLGLLFFERYPRLNNLETYCKSAFVSLPCAALDRLPSSGKHLFTAYEWGGFLIWQRPEYKVFVDGRSPAWKTPSGKSPYTIYLELIQARPGWREYLRNSKTDTLLIPVGSYLDLAILKHSGEWVERYRGKVAVIYSLSD